MNEYVQKGQYAAKEQYDIAMSRALAVRNTALAKMNIDPTDIEKLNRVPMVASFVGLFVNILLLAAMSNFAWLEGTAIMNGQPYAVHLSLGAAIFGPTNDPSRDNSVFCEGGLPCSLKALCSSSPSEEVFSNGMPKTTDPIDWCSAASAGSVVQKLLGFGFIPALAATIVTFLYAGKEVSAINTMLLKMEGMRISIKHIIAGLWAALWLFMFMAMTVYSAMVPDTLGWGTVHVEASFGLLRFSFFLISILGGVLVSHLFELWDTANVTEAFMEFADTELLSWKKALYLELMMQMALYLFLTIYMVDWSLLLVGIVGYYLDAKKQNFKLSYLVFISISIVLDISRLAALPTFEVMTPGERFGNTIWTIILFLKPVIVGTIYFYEKEGGEEERQQYASMEEGRPGYGGTDEIAE